MNGVKLSMPVGDPSFGVDPAPDRGLAGCEPTLRKKRCHVGGKRCDEFDSRTAARMIDGERQRMQRLASREALAAGCNMFCRCAIQRIAETWMAERGEMNPHLVGPPRLWTNAHQRRRPGGA